MMSWFDLMRQAQGSPDLDTLARQFNLSTEQAQKAMAAFLPAFAIGMRQTAEHNDPMQVFRGLPASPFAEFWGQATRAFTPQAQQAGKMVLDQMFGSDDVTRRVAHQAASFAGIGLETMQQMLPLMAGIFAGGLHKWMTGQGAMPGMAGKAAPAPQPPNWVDLWGNWLGTGSQPAAQKPAATPFEAMMAPFLNPPTPAESPAKSEAAESAQAWEHMMGAGREMQKQYLTSLQSIFDGAWNRKPGGS